MRKNKYKVLVLHILLLSPPKAGEQTRLMLLYASEQLIANWKTEWQKFSKSGKLAAIKQRGSDNL